MPRSRNKKKSPKRVLALPDLEQAKSAVLNTVTSKSGQRTYDHAITEFVEWYCSEPRLAFNRTVVLRYRISLEQRQYAPSTINLRLAAVRRIAYEAADSGLLSPELAAGIRRVKGVRRLGVQVGNWPTAEQGKRLLEATCAEYAARQAQSRDAFASHRMWASTGGVAWPHDELHSVARGTLGDCESGWQGWPYSDRSDSSLGQESRGLLDSGGTDHDRSSVPIDQQGRQNLGRRNDAEGSLGSS